MKNLNKYKDIFSSERNLTLKDIGSYENGSEELRNSIEQKAASSSFDQDAMEGWEDLSYNTSILTKINRKILPRKSFHWFTAFIALTIGVASVLIYQKLEVGTPITVKSKEFITQISIAHEKNEINIESADVILPKEIALMIEAPAQDQLNIAKIKGDFAGIEEVELELPLLDPNALAQVKKKSTIISNRTLAKEIYLNDLKLIDYRKSRSNPIVQTKQLTLTGTSANKENKNSEDFVGDWGTVDIPYMQYLEKSIRYFNKAKYKRALARFETIIKSYKLDVNANFYGGLCLYNLGEYEKAIVKFENCFKSEFNNFDEEALWIIALSYEKLMNRNKALEIFEDIAEKKGYYSTLAEEKLK